MDLSKISERITLMKQNVSEIDDAIIKVYESNREISTQIHEAVEKLFTSLRKYERRLINQVEEIAETKLSALRKQKDEVQDLLNDVQNTVKLADVETSLTTEGDNLVGWKRSLQQNLENVKSEEFQTKPAEDSYIEFRFLYSNEDLLEAICNFGAIFTEKGNFENGREYLEEQSCIVDVMKDSKCGDEKEELQTQQKGKEISTEKRTANTAEERMKKNSEVEQENKELIGSVMPNLKGSDYYNNQNEDEMAQSSQCESEKESELYKKGETVNPLIEKVNEKAERLNEVEAKLHLQYSFKEQLSKETEPEKLGANYKKSCSDSAEYITVGTQQYTDKSEFHPVLTTMKIKTEF